MNKTELLAVLDMSEYEQWEWLISRQDIQEMCQNQLDSRSQPKYKRRVLADLAFRLRDEFVLSTPLSNRYAYNNAFEIVYEYEKEWNKIGTDKAGWGLDWSRPIHWIIAALIAKEK